MNRRLVLIAEQYRYEEFQRAYTSTEELVLNVAKALNVDVTPNDIEISHKLRRRGATDRTIAKIISHKATSELYISALPLPSTYNSFLEILISPANSFLYTAPSHPGKTKEIAFLPSVL